MIRELRTFEAQCDLCNDKLIYQSVSEELPAGWDSKFEYDDKFHYCSLCVRAMKTRGEF